ncbi:MAG: hypothetical protein SVZ03_03035 [Spirochaetota bacterium]|nr:hypothetical protein [Spirochaetota bacterium]
MRDIKINVITGHIGIFRDSDKGAVPLTKAMNAGTLTVAMVAGAIGVSVPSGSMVYCEILLSTKLAT